MKDRRNFIQLKPVRNFLHVSLARSVQKVHPTRFSHFGRGKGENETRFRLARVERDLVASILLQNHANSSWLNVARSASFADQL